MAIANPKKISKAKLKVRLIRLLSKAFWKVCSFTFNIETNRGYGPPGADPWPIKRTGYVDISIRVYSKKLKDT